MPGTKPQARPRSPAHVRAPSRVLSRLGRRGQTPDGRRTRLLERFPDHLETLTLLAGHYFDEDDSAAALPLVQQARAIKPLDESLRELEWNIRVRLARSLALAKSFDLGREQFTAAEELMPDCRNEYYFLARRVIFEAKASQAEKSDLYLERAKASLVEPTPLWLALSIESIRYGMTKATQKGYAQMWEADLKNKCTSETAGEMASLLDQFLCAQGRVRRPCGAHQESRVLPAAHHPFEIPPGRHRASLRVSRPPAR